MILPFYEIVRLDDEKAVAVISFPKAFRNPMWFRTEGRKMYISVSAPLRELPLVSSK